MHISKLSLVNYRNFRNANFVFNKGINTIIGENGSGKTNLFRAIRLLLDNSMPRSAINLTEHDFCRSLGNWRGHWIIISLEFSEIGNDETSQSLFLHGTGNLEGETVTKATYNLIFRPKTHVRNTLSDMDGDVEESNNYLASLSIEDYETIFTGKSNVDFTDSELYKAIVGDFDTALFPRNLNQEQIGISLPAILHISNEVSFSFVKALRDVVSDFHGNRTNPLLNLLKLKSGDINQDDFQQIASHIKSLNEEIEQLPDICDVRNDIGSTIIDTLGDTYSPRSISIRSNLTDESDQLFRSLRLFVAESDDGYEDTINEMSLGGANLLYLTLKLLEFKYQKANQSLANFLLIEEPEAHIHTHIQKSLFENINFHNTQIIYSTHSSHISEVSNIRNMNVIGLIDGKCEVFQPASGLADEEIDYIQRYLDAIRNNLLFARSVILVEGDAEEILLPILVKKVIGLSLDEIGITLVNIRSTGFENIARLFDKQRIKKRCSIITDLDKAFFDTTALSNDLETTKKKKAKAIGSEKSGKERQARLDDFCSQNPWVSTFYADHTFEVDFLKSGNHRYFKSLVDEIYTSSSTKNLAKDELSSNDIAKSGSRVLTMANAQGKGWFALSLGKALDYKTVIPNYIFDAIKFAHGNFNHDLIYKMLKHRYQSLEAHVKQCKKIITRLSNDGNHDLKQQYENYLKSYEDGLAIFKPKWQAFNIKSGDVIELKNHLLNDLPQENNDVLSRI